VFGELEHYGIDLKKVAWVSKSIKIDNVLDLTNPVVRKQLGVSLESLTSDSYFVTHALGDFARAQGYNGILFPSARAPGTVNFVELISHVK
jgi:RES domain-containing protein